MIPFALQTSLNVFGSTKKLSQTLWLFDFLLIYARVLDFIIQFRRYCSLLIFLNAYQYED